MHIIASTSVEQNIEQTHYVRQISPNHVRSGKAVVNQPSYILLLMSAEFQSTGDWV